MIIEYIISEKDNKKAAKIITIELLDKKHGLRLINLAYRSISVLLIIFSSIIFIPSLFKVYEQFPEYVLSFLFLSLGVVIYFAGRKYVDNKLKYNRLIRNATQSIELCENEIVFLTDGKLKRILTAEDIFKITDVDNIIFLYLQENIAYFIPPHAFSDDKK
jgi:hypothetical protein